MADVDERPARQLRAPALDLERTDLATLAAEQGVTPVMQPEDLLGDFWPEDERVEDFLAAIQAWQRGRG